MGSYQDLDTTGLLIEGFRILESSRNHHRSANILSFKSLASNLLRNSSFWASAQKLLR
jgi:hypothetical protein